MRQAETNAERMAVVAPISGMAVLRTVWKANTMAEVQEGEEVRAGVPVVDVVNPKTMRVRARVNQADINELQLDQPVKIGLDAYPELSFDGKIAQISPLGVVSTLSPKARVYVVLIQVNGSHPKLMPDLTASLDVTLSRLPGALVVPRDAVGTDGKRAFVRVQRGSSYQEQTVTVGATSALDVVLTSGVDAGAVVARNIAPPPAEDGQDGQDATRRGLDNDAPYPFTARQPQESPDDGRTRPRRRRPVRDGRARFGSRCPDGRRHPRRVRRCAGAPRRNPAAQVDRAVVADAVGRAPDSQACVQRLKGQGRRHRRAVRRHDVAADHPGEAVGVQAGQRRDRAGERPGANRERAERDRADEGEVRHRTRQARHQQGRHGLADRERAGEVGAC